MKQLCALNYILLQSNVNKAYQLGHYESMNFWIT